jgi:hypothetical protein
LQEPEFRSTGLLFSGHDLEFGIDKLPRVLLALGAANLFALGAKEFAAMSLTLPGIALARRKD